jgi:hypothetical protein
MICRTKEGIQDQIFICLSRMHSSVVQALHDASDAVVIPYKRSVHPMHEAELGSLGSLGRNVDHKMVSPSEPIEYFMEQICVQSRSIIPASKPIIPSTNRSIERNPYRLPTMKGILSAIVALLSVPSVQAFYCNRGTAGTGYCEGIGMHTFCVRQTTQPSYR